MERSRTMAELDEVRMAEVRGNIISVLFEAYTAEMTSVSALIRTLDAIGSSLGPEDAAEHLVYLAQQGYVTIVRGREMPKYRTDRATGIAPDAIVFVKLAAKGLQLLKGKIPEDPMVTF
jgi:hypothetical protein